MELQLPPPLPTLGEHVENAVVIIPITELLAALKHNQISAAFAAMHCPSKHLGYLEPTLSQRLMEEQSNS